MPISRGYRLLGSDFGMDGVEAPAWLEEIMPPIPTNPAEIRMILHALRLQILYDTGMELDRLRRPLRGMEIVFMNWISTSTYLSKGRSLSRTGLRTPR